MRGPNGISWFLALALLVLAGFPAAAADPWHLAGWQGRALVAVRKPLAERGVDTAAVRVLCQGLAKADVSDYRVLDAAGKPVPFQVAFHDPARYSLISFRATDPRQHFFVYFGNPQAPAAKEQISVNPAPGSGPPKGEWVPRHGLVLETRERPVDPREFKSGDVKHPRTVADMAKLLAAATVKYGARYQRKISDGYNPFGPSDNYVSIYRGWLNIPAAGTYQFCTVSSKASFSFIDGKELVHWPGRHTTERGARGEVNAAVQLSAGLHYVEYYHETVPLEHMAFLGWRPSAGAGPFAAIPEKVFTAPHPAEVTAYESPKGPLPRFESVICDSVWPVERDEGQYTRCRFRALKSGFPAGTTYHWDFGDGQTGAGAEAEHVYLTLGNYTVKLTAKRAQGTATAGWPLRVFEIEHVTEQFKEGSPPQYARLAMKYDRTRLDAGPLKELMYLLAETEQPAEAIRVGQGYLRRFGQQKSALETARVRRLLADCAIRLGRGGLREAVAHYQAALVPQMPTAEKLDVLARLVRLLGIERGLPDEAANVMVQVEKTWAAGTDSPRTRAAFRRALIAGGDVLLWHREPARAARLYERAEALGRHIPSQVRKARIGAYPNTIRELMKAANYGAALDIVRRWEETFPTDKPNGQTFYWRGKLLALRGRHHDAARYLARTIGLSSGAGYESEARWLLAESLDRLGEHAKARRELARLVATGIKDRFTDMARAKLKKEPGAEKSK
jgi:tetratricopeptide (TPR) repeat protein